MVYEFLNCEVNVLHESISREAPGKWGCYIESGTEWTFKRGVISLLRFSVHIFLQIIVIYLFAFPPLWNCLGASESSYIVKYISQFSHEFWVKNFTRTSNLKKSSIFRQEGCGFSEWMNKVGEGLVVHDSRMDKENQGDCEWILQIKL